MGLLNSYDPILINSLDYRSLPQLFRRSLRTSRRPAKQRSKLTTRSSLYTVFQSAFNRG